MFSRVGMLKEAESHGQDLSTVFKKSKRGHALNTNHSGFGKRAMALNLSNWLKAANNGEPDACSEHLRLISELPRDLNRAEVAVVKNAYHDFRSALNEVGLEKNAAGRGLGQVFKPLTRGVGNVLTRGLAVPLAAFSAIKNNLGPMTLLPLAATTGALGGAGYWKLRNQMAPGLSEAMMEEQLSDYIHASQKLRDRMKIRHGYDG